MEDFSEKTVAACGRRRRFEDLNQAFSVIGTIPGGRDSNYAYHCTVCCGVHIGRVSEFIVDGQHGIQLKWKPSGGGATQAQHAKLLHILAKVRGVTISEAAAGADLMSRNMSKEWANKTIEFLERKYRDKMRDVNAVMKVKVDLTPRLATLATRRAGPPAPGC